MLIRLVLGLLFFLFITSCKQIESDVVLKSKIITCVEKGDTLFDLQQFTDFDWETLIIIGPYTDVDRFEDELDINLILSNIQTCNIEMT